MIEGKYQVFAKNASSDELYLKHEQQNLITDYGLNYFGSGSKTKTSNSNWNLDDCGVWLKDFPEPTKLLEELPLPYLTGLLTADFRSHFVFNVGRSPTIVSNKRFDDGKVCYIETTYEYSFDQGAIVGDMYGIHLGTADSYGTDTYIRYSDPRMYPWLYNKNSSGSAWVYDHVFSIFSALKFKTPEGVNTTIPVLPVEQIFIRYTLRKYLPKYIPPKEFTFATEVGTTHKCIIEPRYWDVNYNGSYSTNGRNAFSRYSNTSSETYYAANVVAPNGQSSTEWNDSNFRVSTRAYKPYDYKQISDYFLDINFFNRPIAYIDFYNTMGSMRATFTPPIPKDNTLETSFSMGWGWGREEDLITYFHDIQVTNPKFTTDLSGWTLSETSTLIPYDQDGTKAVSLRTQNKTETLSQIVNVSDTILENRRLTCQFRLKGNLASMPTIVLEYIGVDDAVLATDSVNTSATDITDIANNLFIQRNVPVEAITAQKIKITFTLKTNNSANAYISLADIRMFLNNTTPIKG